MLMMRPWPASFITTAACRAQLNDPLRCTARTASKSSAFIFTRVRSRTIPALFTKMSSWPNASTALSTMRLAASKSVTESWFGIASPPNDSISRHTCVAGSSPVPAPSRAAPTSLTTTRAPAWAMASANSRPMPRPEPVTIATRPSRRPTVLASARNRGGGPGEDLNAVLVGDGAFDVDDALVVVFAGHRGPAGQGVAGPDLLREADLEAPQRGGAEPVLEDPGHEPRGEHPVPEHRRVPNRGRDRVVMVHRVEVSRRARVPHEIGAGEVLDDEGWCLVADGQGVERRCARGHGAERIASQPKGDTPVRLFYAPVHMARRDGAAARQADRGPDGPVQGRELRARGRRTLGRLLDAGATVFTDRGFHAARVDDIVKAARTSHGTFYLYFTSKDDLFRALAEGVAAATVTSRSSRVFACSRICTAETAR